MFPLHMLLSHDVYYVNIFYTIKIRIIKSIKMYSVIQKDELIFFLWLLPQMCDDSEDFIFQQDGATPHWHRDV